MLGRGESVGFTELLGPCTLSGVDCITQSVKSYMGEGYDDCNVLNFIIDGRTYSAVEDPDDGYRSELGYLIRTDFALTNNFPGVAVRGRMRDGKTEVLEFYDVETKKLVLAVGTNMDDDYYPEFVGEFYPENMIINADIG